MVGEQGLRQGAGMNLPRCIETPRVRLRDPRPADAESAFRHWGSDPAVLRYLGILPHESPDDTRRQIGHDLHRWLKGSGWVWAMTLRASAGVPGLAPDEAFGLVELQPMSQPGMAAHHLRLGYLMGQAAWGRGLMREALAALGEIALAQPSVWRLDALCDLDNLASARLLARLGWACEGCHRRAVIHPNVSPTPRDVWVYALTR